ncbi:MAG TPA: DUF4214 domain-containing protein [Pirellulales bacterium]|nr:DUF4214 domain-containing protein [Pirellulales bacterium]
MQFIELEDPANGESHLDGHFISSNANKFVFPNDLPSDATANHHFLIGTVDYTKQAGAVTPDFTVPDNFFSVSGDMLDYADVDSFSFAAGQLPTDGSKSMFRDVNTFALSSGLNSETNLAGQTGSINLNVQPNTAQLQKFVTKVYSDLLGRAPEPDGLTFWTNQLASGVPRSQIAEALTHTPEYFSTIIKPAYLNFLGRPADDAGLNFWIGRMQNGLTDEHLEAGFIGSAEFYQHAGGTDKLWVDAMYMDLLGRQPDSGGETFWVQQLGMGAKRADVAFGFAASVEREQQRVTADYSHFLGRTPDQTGLNFWVSQFTMGFTNENLIAGFIASDEYFQKAISS